MSSLEESTQKYSDFYLSVSQRWIHILSDASSRRNSEACPDIYLKGLSGLHFLYSNYIKL